MLTETDILDKKIKSLDFSYIIDKMCSSLYHLPIWEVEHAKECELLYKRFLYLLVKYPTAPLVPTKEIDEFWHNHILFTRRYMADCKFIAGKYIHHNPSDLDEDSLEKLQIDFKHTQDLYFIEFNEPLRVYIDDFIV